MDAEYISYLHYPSFTVMVPKTRLMKTLQLINYLILPLESMLNLETGLNKWISQKETNILAILAGSRSIRIYCSMSSMYHVFGFIPT